MQTFLGLSYVDIYIINRVGKIANFGHKEGKDFGKRAAHPSQMFLGRHSKKSKENGK